MPRFEGGSDTGGGGGGGASVAAQMAQNEVPGGLINGTNTLYTTASLFISGTLQVFLNGDLQEGGGNDYTEGGDLQSFTFVLAPKTGDKILLSYIKP